MNEDEKVNIHAALAMITSGQLLFLGLIAYCARNYWAIGTFFLNSGNYAGQTRTRIPGRRGRKGFAEKIPKKNRTHVVFLVPA